MKKTNMKLMNMKLMICIFAWMLFFGSGSAHSEQMLLGSDVLSQKNFRHLEGKRVGLLTNLSGVNRAGISTIELLHKAKNVNVVALFAAEHGLRGDIRAGLEFADSIDPKTGLDIFSLYAPGPIREPTSEMLKKIDILVYDLQDTGSRSYTFIATMGKAMAECGRAGVDFMILDRPNPLGGLRVEGPNYDPRFRSFVGYWPIPYVYGMTSGELARMINGEKMNAHPCRLIVVPMSGWKRSMVWKDTGLKWIPTSPNIPYGHSPMYQVATGMIGEIGGVEIGIHTKRPFQYVAADWLKASQSVDHLNGINLPGVEFRETSFPSQRFSTKGQPIPAIEIVFNDSSQAPLSIINFHLLETLKQVSGRDLFEEALARGKDWGMFDKVNGGDATRKSLQLGKPVSRLVEDWEGEIREFEDRRKRYLIYK